MKILTIISLVLFALASLVVINHLTRFFPRLISLLESMWLALITSCRVTIEKLFLKSRRLYNLRIKIIYFRDLCSFVMKNSDLYRPMDPQIIRRIKLLLIRICAKPLNAKKLQSGPLFNLSINPKSN